MYTSMHTCHNTQLVGSVLSYYVVSFGSRGKALTCCVILISPSSGLTSTSTEYEHILLANICLLCFFMFVCWFFVCFLNSEFHVVQAGFEIIM